MSNYRWATLLGVMLLLGYGVGRITPSMEAVDVAIRFAYVVTVDEDTGERVNVTISGPDEPISQYPRIRGPKLYQLDPAGEYMFIWVANPESKQTISLSADGYDVVNVPFIEVEGSDGVKMIGRLPSPTVIKMVKAQHPGVAVASGPVD